MARVLVVYATRTKSTQEIAELVAEGIRFSGNEAVVVDVKKIKSEAACPRARPAASTGRKCRNA